MYIYVFTVNPTSTDASSVPMRATMHRGVAFSHKLISLKNIYIYFFLSEKMKTKVKDKNIFLPFYPGKE